MLIGGVVGDWLDGVYEWFVDNITVGVTAIFEIVADTLTDTFDGTTEADGLVKVYLTGHPANFTGNADGTGVHIWTTIETLCNNVVVPIGGFVLTVILLNDLIQTVIKGNNFKEFDDSIFIKWIIKALCGVLLVSNVFYIASGLFAFGTNACANGLSVLLGDDSFLSESLSLQHSALEGLDIGYLIAIFWIALVVLLGLIVMKVAIVIVLASRIIEVFMYLGIAPIPMATMMDSGDWGQIGKNWVRQLLALSFQGFFILIALGIFKTLFANVITQINAGGDGVIVQLTLLLGYTMALVFTIFRSGTISRSAFHAH